MIKRRMSILTTWSPILPEAGFPHSSVNFRSQAWFALKQLLAALLMLLTACSSELSLEQQITAKLRHMEAHIEAGERRDFMAYVTKDFHGQGGEFNYDQLNGMLLYQLRRYKRVHVQMLGVKVLPAGVDEADASLQVLLTGGEGWLPDSGQLYQVESLWQQLDGDWMLQSAHWQPVRMGDK